MTFDEKATPIIDRYRRAFAAANPHVDVPDVRVWRPGWIAVDGRGEKRRLSTMIEWCERLERRALTNSEDPNG